ncbi:unnamed protein product [Candidula unifasciata]|uniref:Uncharacterized protein n=1 Tax=Candidula unifasciata TaxID=100452 RepID=A0A8S3Z078_9EUPU|nr:unnamed protein product [Candidula unifasciata]
MNWYLQCCIVLLVNSCATQVVDINSLQHLIKRPDVQVTTPSPEVVSAMEAYGRLKDDLMNRLVVKKKIPPSISNSDIVYLFLEPLQLISVDEVEQTIHLSHIIDIRWIDPNMRWNPTLYGNISEIEISTSSVWTPRLALPKSIMDGVVTLPDHVTLTSNGNFISSFSGYINSLCQLDMAYFPFDHHTCTIVFMGETSFKVLPDNTRRHVDVAMFFKDGGEWELQPRGCFSKDDGKTYIECFLYIKRRSSFYVTNLVVPMVFTSAMTLIVFWIPAESGEKISFLVSVFVSTSVFLNYIVETIPRSMGSLPHINALLVFVVIKVIAATAATTVVLRRYNTWRFQYNSKGKSEGLYGNQKVKKIQEVMMVPADLSLELSNVYSNSSRTKGPKKEDLLLKGTEKGVSRCCKKSCLREVVIWWCSLSHDELDTIFFGLLACVSLVTYCALLCV